MDSGWLRLILFVVLSSPLIWFTLRRPYAHRGYRLLAFECVLAMIFLQAGAWFANPLRPAQLLSWLMLAGSLGLALYGFYLLRTQGAPDGDIETTTSLVTSGAYSLIRHPLYASLLLFGFGAAIKHITPWSLLILLVLSLAVQMTAMVEERTNLERFGEAYKAYMQRTKRFVPYIW